MEQSKAERPTRWIDARTLCKRLGISDTSLRRLIREGTFPAGTKLGAAPNCKRLWPEAAVEQWMEARHAERPGRKDGDHREHRAAA